MQVRIGTDVAETLVRINEWLTRIQAGSTYQRVEHMRPDTNLVEQIAEDLIAGQSGTEGRLLSKSLQEAMYYPLKFDPDIEYDELKTRLSRYLRRWGTGSFNRRFLSLFFFNFIRFHAGESFRAAATISTPFEQYLEEIDHVCQQTVASVWKSFERSKSPLNLPAATKLVSEIEQRLLG